MIARPFTVAFLRLNWRGFAAREAVAPGADAVSKAPLNATMATPVAAAMVFFIAAMVPAHRDLPPALTDAPEETLAPSETASARHSNEIERANRDLGLG
jgi:hypothetical protein